MSVLPDMAGESVFREKNKERWEDEDELDCNLKTCVTMLGLGIGQCIGAWVCGKLGEKLGKRSTLHVNFILSSVSLVMAIIVMSVSRVSR